MRPQDSLAHLAPVWRFVFFLLGGVAWFLFIESAETLLNAHWIHGQGFGWLALLTSAVVLAGLAYALIMPVGRRAGRAEQRLRDVQGRAQLVMANTADAVFVHDLSGRLLDVNQQAEGHLGYSRAELLKMRVEDITVDVEQHDRMGLWRDMPTDTALLVRSVHHLKSGQQVPVEVRLIKRIEAEGAVVIALVRTAGAQIQADLQRLVEGTAQVTGRAFFSTLARLLAQVFEVRYAWIGRLDGEDPGLVHALAIWNGKDVVSADYRLAGTPCEEALGMTASYYPAELRKHFRRVAPIPVGRATSYFGVPLRDASKKAIGILALLDNKVMESDPGRLTLLSILAGRVVAEMSRLDADEALAASEEKYRRLMESAHDPILVADAATGLIVSANQQAGRLLGRPVETLIGMHQKDLHPAEEQTRYAELFRRYSVQGGVAHDLQVVRADGGRVPVDIGTGIVEVGGKRLILGIFRDMTERHYVEQTIRAINATLETRVLERTQQLSQVNARLGGIIETAMDAIVSVNEAHTIVLFNPAAERMFQISQAEALGKNLDTFLPEPFRANHAHHVREFGEAGVTRRGMGHLGEVAAQRSNGQIFPAEISISALDTERGRIFTSVIRDISERIEIEQQRQLNEDRMRRLTDHLQSVREEERGRIAHEIHDELGGLLTGIKIDLRFLAKQLPAEPSQAQDKVTELTSLTESAIQTVRKIATDLRPSVLDNLGLLPALEWQAKEFQRRIGIKCQFSAEAPDLDLTPEQATAIFRIVQESLTNVARHAQASRVRISAERLDDELVVTVRDNGLGIKQGELLSINSFGLLGMYERARRFGGKVSITGHPDQGTTVNLTFPLATPDSPYHLPT